MKAAVLVKNGPADKAFEIREIPKPMPGSQEVLIKVEGFGLNYADVMARQGNYPSCPPLPAVIGYDVCGTIEAIGGDGNPFRVGDRVMALTRFGGYAEYAVASTLAIAKIPRDLNVGQATALATQYVTAYHCAEEAIHLNKGDHVLVHAAAGGVGTALIQLARMHDCTIYGTAGSDEKLEYLRQQGVHHPINYRRQDFAETVRSIGRGRKLDAIFDPVGGDSVKKGIRLLSAGGRIIVFGASSITGKGMIGKIRTLLGFGFYHPIGLMQPSKGIVGVNMLAVADNRPDIISRCFKAVSKLYSEGHLHPTVAKIYEFGQIGEAHAFLESRKSIGKIAVRV